MALRWRDLLNLTHPARRSPGLISGTKANRAAVLDYQANRSSFAYSGMASPKFKDYESYESAYKLAWVRACVQVLAYNLADTPFRLVRPGGTTEEDDTEIDDSPFLNLLQHPNPYQTGFELREAWVTDLELTGNAYIALEAPTVRGLPTELYRLRPSRVTILPDPKRFIAGYQYTVNGRAVRYAADELLHIKYPNPLDDYYGMGTIEAGEARFESEMAMGNHERNFWNSGAKITGILKTAESLDDSTFERIKNNIRAFFQRSGYSTLLLENGIDYQSVSDSPAKLGMLDMAIASRDQIMAMFGVPATKLGILERANYKADEADRFFWTESLGPKQTRLEEGLQPLVDLFHPGQDYRLRFKRRDFTDDLPQMQTAKTMSEVGVFTADEIRQYTGRDPMPDQRGANIIMALQTTVPLDLGGPMATVNERRKDQGLPRLDGGDFTIVLPRGAVPLDVKDEELAAKLPTEGQPVASPSGAPSPSPGKPSNVARLRQPPAPVAARTAGKSVQRVSVRAPATTHLVQTHRTEALARGEAHKDALITFFGAQQQRVVDRLAGFKRRKAALDTSGIWDDATEDGLLGAALEPIWQDAINGGTSMARAILKGKVPLENPRLAELRGQLASRVSGINATTRDAMDEQITEGLRRGYSTTQIAAGVPTENYKGVSGVFAAAAGYRAETIARTETMYAFQSASVATYREAGVPEVELLDGTRWDSICADRNGEIVPLDEAEMIADHPNGTLAMAPVVGGLT